MERDVSPVYAPAGAWWMFCAPSCTLVPRRRSATTGRKGAGGHTRTSQDEAAAPSSALTAAATSAARDCRACVLRRGGRECECVGIGTGMGNSQSVLFRARAGWDGSDRRE